MSLLKVNSISHLSSAANNLTLESSGSIGTFTVNGDIQMVSTTLTSPAVAGILEYNSPALYFTPVGTQRGIVPGMQFYRVGSNYNGVNGTANQSLLGVGTTLSSNTVYAFEIHVTLGKSAGTTSHTVAHSWGGTATVASMGYSYFFMGTSNGTLVNNPVYSNRLTASTLPGVFVMSGAITASAYSVVLLIKGIVEVSAGGTFIPQYTLSAAPGGAYFTEPGSYMYIYPIGTSSSSSGSNVVIGTWA